MSRDKVMMWVFVGVFVFSVIMIFVENDFFTGHATSESTVSQVTISQFFSISLSSALSTGINFGTQNSTTANDINASNNFNASSNTEYYVLVSSDSNTAVNFSIWADGPLNTTGSDEIGLGNETYAFNVTTNDASYPALSEAVSLTESSVAAGGNVAAGGQVYYRFWLDIPAGTPVGVYNNTINFQGVAS